MAFLVNENIEFCNSLTELFISDVRGEDEAFSHILNNASGVIFEKVGSAFPQMGEEEKRDLASLLYYPQEQLPC